MYLKSELWVKHVQALPVSILFTQVPYIFYIASNHTILQHGIYQVSDVIVLSKCLLLTFGVSPTTVVVTCISQWFLSSDHCLGVITTVSRQGH